MTKYSGTSWKDLGKESLHDVSSAAADEESEDGETEEEEDVIDDPRWRKITKRSRIILGAKDGLEKPEVRSWRKQENWGRKIWKEAAESTILKLTGEGIFGVGPVSAALSAGRRECYALYIQTGMDLSSPNKKKKDKTKLQKILILAEKMGLTRKEASKHDLNMVVDNRPHQGLVLDASPLEMVPIKELHPVSSSLKGEDSPPLWLALDQVTDPQNLGAIIRSAYFFGASGIVVCAKNSAPLSPVVSKASAGSLELVELRSCSNMVKFLLSSAGNGWRVLGGSVSQKADPLGEVLPGGPTVLVLGSEGTGLRTLVERACSRLVRIAGNVMVSAAERVEDGEVGQGRKGRPFLAVESLNVSVAAGVLLHGLVANKHVT